MKRILERMREFKSKKCENIWCNILYHLLFHKLSQILALSLVFLISGAVFQNTIEGTKINDIAWGVFLVTAGMLASLVVVTTIFAWIINPIRDRRRNKK